jgi:hypothetical protein
MTVNNNKNTQNQKVVINLSTSSLHEHHKRKKHVPRVNAPPPPMPVGIHNVYQPQQSLISPPHADIPPYFASALTNRDLALSGLRNAAMAQDDHIAMRNAYVAATVPGAMPTHVPDEAAAPVPPVPAPHVNEPEIVHEPQHVPLPDNEPLMDDNPAYEPAHDHEDEDEEEHRRNVGELYNKRINDLHNQYKQTTSDSVKARFRKLIREEAQLHHVPMFHPGTTKVKNVHKLSDDIRAHLNSIYEAGG